jgi:flagellar motor switch protein FliM
MSTDRVLSQEEIDSVFRSMRQGPATEDPAATAQVYDFRRPDRIAKDQLRAIHLLHENFARSLSSSLSAFLRAYVAVNLVSVEQLSFLEFSQCLPSPSAIISLSMRPYDGNSLLEINPSLIFPILEMLLGGSGKVASKVNREITEIEQAILESVFRIILNDLRHAWQSVTPIEFAIESHETEPQLLQILAPNEAVVAVSMEARVGDNSGMMNIGIPSITVKMLRQKFDQQWSMRRAHSTLLDQERMLKLVRPSKVCLDLRLQGPTLRLSELLEIEPGQIMTFDHPVTRPLDLLINGRLKYKTHATIAGQKRAAELESAYVALDYAPIRDVRAAGASG